MYSIREVFLTLQGEGVRAGTRSVFVRFAGCNLWNGNPADRLKGKGACAKWCDTDFFKGTPMSAADIRQAVNRECPVRVPGHDWIVFTGGEPTLQLDQDLIRTLKDDGWRLACETNGTNATPELGQLDWVTVSPKQGSWLQVYAGDELKVVYPGSEDAPWTEQQLEGFEGLGYAHLFLQPCDPAVIAEYVDKAVAYERNLARCIALILRRPRWRLSLQTHKIAKLP